MAFLRRWLLMALLLLLGGGSGWAASREDRAYTAAVKAFNDEQYTLAQAQLTKFLQNYRNSTNAPMAVLLLAQSEYQLKDYESAIKRLADPASLARAKTVGLNDDYTYWRAQAQLGRGDLAGAAQTFVAVAQNHPESPLALNAVVTAATAFATLGERGQVDDLLGNPNGLFQRAARLDPANVQVANGRLLQADSQCEQQHFAAAIEILGRLNPATLLLDQDWKRARLLYRAQVSQHDLPAALAAAVNLVQIARLGQGGIWATNLAEGVACQAQTLESLGRLEEAGAVWQANFTNTAPVELQRQAVLKLADLADRLNQSKEAEARLEDYLAQFPQSPAAGAVLLAVGELHLKDYVTQPGATNDLAVAQGKFRQFFEANPSGLLAGKAALDEGWCNWLAAQKAREVQDTNVMRLKLEASLVDFQAAISNLPPASEDLPVARFKAGDARFALADFTGARSEYQAVLAAAPPVSEYTNSLACRTLYQLLRTDLALTNSSGMEETMRQLVGKYFVSAPADSGRLLAGQGFSDFDQPAKARAVFAQFARERTNSPLLPEVAFAAARTFAQEQRWPEAITNYQAWLEAYPTNDLRPRVEYARNWAVAQSGDETRAFELFTNFVGEYPANATVTPLARWWVAGHYFQQGVFVAAGINYQLLNDDFPAHALAYPARLMAARAAMGRFNYQEAIDSYLDPLARETNCPAGLQTQALFAYCEALRELKDTNSVRNLQTATNILGLIYTKNPTNDVGALAWDEVGDCNLLLGAYDAATNAYALARMLPVAPALQYRATVGLGNALKEMAERAASDADRKALLSQALGEYLMVIYAGSEEWWVKKAAWQALPLIGKADFGTPEQESRFFQRLETMFPQLKETLEKKRAALPP